MARLHDILERQGIKVRSPADYAAYEEMKEKRRANNIQTARVMLADADIRYTRIREREQFIIRLDPCGHIDYYPAIGRWEWNRGDGTKGVGYGIRNLIKFLQEVFQK